MEAKTRERSSWRERAYRARFAVVVIAFIPLILLSLLVYALYAVLLRVAVWTLWNTRGTYVLFVYSDSPVWKPYIEQNIVPKLPSNSVILNWSERRRWPRWSLATMLFWHFGGRREFNPLAVVIRPLEWGETFRFWQAFRDYKHGKPAKLAQVAAAFFRALAGEVEIKSW
jgi:hypothetical protein